MIGTDGERGSWKPVLTACIDDEDDDTVVYIYSAVASLELFVFDRIKNKFLDFSF